MKKHITLPLALSAFALSPLHSATVYDETIDGDIGNTTSPTFINNIMIGSNEVIGTINEGSAFNPDVFTFGVPLTQKLVGLTLNSLDGSNHFFAFNLLNVDTTSASGNLIASLIGNANVGENLLVTLGGGGSFGGSGTTTPLSSDLYTVWIQETNNSENNYSFSIETMAVPEPSSALLLSLSSLALLKRRKR